MKKDITVGAAVGPGVEEAWREVGVSFERFCPAAGVATLADMMERDAVGLCGPPVQPRARPPRSSLGAGGRQA